MNTLTSPRFLATFAGCLLCGVAMRAQWNPVGSAFPPVDDCVQLTSFFTGQTGAAWHDCPIHLGADFDLDFTVNLGGNDGGADGMCFVLHQEGSTDNDLVGGSGGDIGYGEDPFGATSMAVEIDTHYNDTNNDPWFDHIAINSSGNVNHNLSPAVQADPNSGNIETGQSYDFRVLWNAGTNTLRVYFNGALRQTLTLDLTNDIFNGNPLVNWGWTGTTGGQTNIHSFCLEDAFYSTHIEAVTVLPEGPWQFCAGDEAVLTATPLPPSESAIWVVNGTDELLVTESGTFDLFAQDIQGCPTHGSIDVEVLPGPDLALLVDPEIVICEGPPLTLLATAQEGADIQWEGLPGTSYEVDESGVYVVEASLGACVETESVDVLFQAKPVIEFFHEGNLITDEASLCGDEIFLLATATEGGNAVWEETSSSYLLVDQDGMFVATADANGCPGDPDSIQVNLLALPGANITSAPSSLCWETSGVVSAVLDDESNVVNWTLPPGTSDLNAAGPGEYTLNLISDFGCERTEQFDYIMLPPINTGLVATTALCEDATALLTVTGNVDDLNWNVGGSSPNLSVSSSMGEGPFVATVTLGACTQSDTAFVTWWPTPSVGSLPDTVSRCVLDPAFNFNWPAQSDAPVGAWVWSVNGDGASAGYSITEAGDYAVEVRDNATGCLDTHELHLDVLPNIGVNATVQDALVCIGDSTLMEVEIVAVQNTDPFALPFALDWSIDGATGLDHRVGAGTHQVTVTNACGSSSDLVVVEDEYCGCNVWVPNAFTPDSDGLNDGFQIVSSCEWDSFEFTVFNRWGERVWFTDDPDSPWSGGTTLLGDGNHFVPPGQYAYRVRFQYTDDGVLYTEDKSGRIAIIR